MKKIVFLAFMLTGFLAFSQEPDFSVKVEVTKNIKISEATRDSYVVPVSEIWHVELTDGTKWKNNGGSGWVSEDALTAGENTVTADFAVRTSPQNGIEVGPSGSVGSTPYLRFIGGTSPDEVYLYMTDNYAVLSNYSNADIDAVGDNSIITKRYFDANAVNFDWGTPVDDHLVPNAAGTWDLGGTLFPWRTLMTEDIFLYDDSAPGVLDWRIVPNSTHLSFYEHDGSVWQERYRMKSGGTINGNDDIITKSYADANYGGGTDDQTAAEVPYTNNSQTTVQGALDDLYTNSGGSNTVTALSTVTDNMLMRGNSTGTRQIQDSGIRVDDNDHMSGVGNIVMDGSLDTGDEGIYTGEDEGVSGQRWRVRKSTSVENLEFLYQQSANTNASGLYSTMATINETGVPTNGTDLIDLDYFNNNISGGGFGNPATANLAMADFDITNIGELYINGSSTDNDDLVIGRTNSGSYFYDEDSYNALTLGRFDIAAATGIGTYTGDFVVTGDITANGNDMVGSSTTPPTGWSQVTEVYQSDYLTNPTPASLPSGAIGIQSNAPPADILTAGATTISSSDIVMLDNTTDDVTSFAINDEQPGDLIVIYLNQATEPSFTGITLKTDPPDVLDWTTDSLANIAVKLYLFIEYDGEGTRTYVKM